MNVLLIGGTGCLSSAIARLMVNKGMCVSMINRGRRTPVAGSEVIVADCHDYALIKDKLNGRHFDAVIDFLCYTTEQVESSFRLYSRFADQYIFISSCAVYDTSRGGVCDERSPKVLPIWKYSVDKWACECRLKELAKESACKCTVVRPSVTYGETRIPYGIAPIYGYHWTLVARILAGKPIIRWNGGVNRCNMMRTEEFAVGVVGLVGNVAAYGEAYNVCGDECPTFNDVLDSISEAIGVKAKVVDVTSDFYAQELPERAGEILGGRSIDAINSNEKIKKLVPEFVQRIMIKEGVKKTIEEYRDQNYQYGIDWRFDAQTDRIIRKWSKLGNCFPGDYKLGFVDYLGAATIKDRWHYFQVYHERSCLIRVINKILWALRHSF